MARFYFSSIYGGVSTEAYAALNLGDHVGDSPIHVSENRDVLARQLGLKSISFMNQVHGSAVVQVDSTTKQIPTCDAIVTTEKSLGLAVLTADCIPLLIDGENCIAAIHVGRRGLVSGVITESIAVLKNLGATRFKAVLGPSICGKCYEVDLTMYDEISSQLPSTSTSREVHSLDLPSGAIDELTKLGVATKVHHICTMESPDYFSYRRSGIAGRMAGVISL